MSSPTLANDGSESPLNTLSCTPSQPSSPSFAIASPDTVRVSEPAFSSLATLAVETNAASRTSVLNVETSVGRVSSLITTTNTTPTTTNHYQASPSTADDITDTTASDEDNYAAFGNNFTGLKAGSSSTSTADSTTLINSSSPLPASSSPLPASSPPAIELTKSSKRKLDDTDLTPLIHGRATTDASQNVDTGVERRPKRVRTRSKKALEADAHNDEDTLMSDAKHLATKSRKKVVENAKKAALVKFTSTNVSTPVSTGISATVTAGISATGSASISATVTASISATVTAGISATTPASVSTISSNAMNVEVEVATPAKPTHKSKCHPRKRSKATKEEKAAPLEKKAAPLEKKVAPIQNKQENAESSTTKAVKLASSITKKSRSPRKPKRKIAEVAVAAKNEQVAEPAIKKAASDVKVENIALANNQDNKDISATTAVIAKDIKNKKGATTTAAVAKATKNKIEAATIAAVAKATKNKDEAATIAAVAKATKNKDETAIIAAVAKDIKAIKKNEAATTADAVKATKNEDGAATIAAVTKDIKNKDEVATTATLTKDTRNKDEVATTAAVAKDIKNKDEAASTATATKSTKTNKRSKGRSSSKRKQLNTPPSDPSNPSSPSPPAKKPRYHAPRVKPPKGLVQPSRKSDRATKLSPKAREALGENAPPIEEAVGLGWSFQGDGSWAEPKVLTPAEHAMELRERELQKINSKGTGVKNKSRVYSIRKWKEVFAAELPEPTCHEIGPDEEGEGMRGGRGGDETVGMVDEEYVGRGKGRAVESAPIKVKEVIVKREPTDEEDLANVATFYAAETSVVHHANRVIYEVADEKAKDQTPVIMKNPPPYTEDQKIRMSYAWDSLDPHHQQAPESCCRSVLPEPAWKTKKYERELVGKFDAYSAPFKAHWEAPGGNGGESSSA